MQELSVPVIHVVKPDDNVTDDVFANAENRPDAAGFKRKVNGAWTPVTWREFAGQVRGLAAGQLTPTLKLCVPLRHHAAVREPDRRPIWRPRLLAALCQVPMSRRRARGR